jgi:CubicO group peptidase (beta-lactamase class C family)
LICACAAVIWFGIEVSQFTTARPGVQIPGCGSRAVMGNYIQISMLKRFIFFGTICALLSIIASCSSSKNAVKTDDNFFDEIGKFLQSLVDTGGIPGIAIAITNGQDIVYSKGFGVTNVETKEKLEPYHTFHIASISKTFTATAVMQLYEKGKIDIDKPIDNLPAIF